MKYSLIGCGRISMDHVKAVINNHLKFVAVYDIEPEYIEAVLAKYNLEIDEMIKRYPDYKRELRFQRVIKIDSM